MLEKGIVAFKERYKRYPVTIDEMISKNFIKLPEVFLQSFIVTISPSNGAFTIEEKEEAN
jgi:hypothetical protein